MAHSSVMDIAKKLTRSAFNAHAVVANPTVIARQQLLLLTFRHAYRWFPLTKPSCRTGAFEIDPERLAAGYSALSEKRLQRRRQKKRLVSRVGTAHVEGEALPDEVAQDIRSHWYVQPSVTELVHHPDNVVPNLGTKGINPLAVLEMARPSSSKESTKPFDRCYHAAMLYYKELLTKMFSRPVYLVSSWSTDFGVWDASFVAYFLRHHIEENLSLAQGLRILETQLGRGNWVRPVRHFDGTANYSVRAWRVYLNGRFHTSPFGRKENARSIIHGQVPAFQPDKYIDYFQTTAQTSQGVVGIKVWIWLDVPK